MVGCAAVDRSGGANAGRLRMISVVSEMVARIAGADPERKVFASFRHAYELHAPVDQATLARAEQAIGAPLPDEYRRFIVDVADGGAGPYYGVLPLGAALSRLENALG